MCVEIWKDIEGYEGVYQISSLGRVRSFIGRYDGEVLIDTLSPKVMKNILADYGDSGQKLYRIELMHKQFHVHHLVAKHFLEGYFPRCRVAWKDNNVLNNRADNLYITNHHPCYGTKTKIVTKEEIRNISLENEDWFYIYDARNYLYSSEGRVLQYRGRGSVPNFIKIYIYFNKDEIYVKAGYRIKNVDNIYVVWDRSELDSRKCGSIFGKFDYLASTILHDLKAKYDYDFYTIENFSGYVISEDGQIFSINNLKRSCEPLKINYEKCKLKDDKGETHYTYLEDILKLKKDKIDLENY